MGTHASRLWQCQRYLDALSDIGGEGEGEGLCTAEEALPGSAHAPPPRIRSPPSLLQSQNSLGLGTVTTLPLAIGSMGH